MHEIDYALRLGIDRSPKLKKALKYTFSDCTTLIYYEDYYICIFFIARHLWHLSETCSLALRYSVLVEKSREVLASHDSYEQRLLLLGAVNYPDSVQTKKFFTS